MRRPFVIFLGLISCAVLALLFLLLQLKEKGATEEFASPLVQNANRGGARLPRGEQNQQDRIDALVKSLTIEEVEGKPEGIDMMNWAAQVAFHRQAVANDGPVELYSQIIDQDGDPLPGVEVQARLSAVHTTLMAAREAGQKSNSQKFTLKAEDDGSFQIRDMTGSALLIRMTKLGYKQLHYENANFVFVPKGNLSPQSKPRHQADPENPVVFVMERLP